MLEYYWQLVNTPLYESIVFRQDDKDICGWFLDWEPFLLLPMAKVQFHVQKFMPIIDQ
jgi:hypothetical protein